MLKLMYITNDPKVAVIAADAGVDRIFIDMEVRGKAERQGGMDTVQSHHIPEDVAKVREAIGDRAEIVTRINPVYEGTEEEIEAVLRNGTDWVMLPMWKTVEELSRFCSLIAGRARTIPLLEHIDAVNVLDEALKVPGIDEVFIGLNDLHLSLYQRFMFEPLADGMVEELGNKIRSFGVPFGFGGIGRPGKGLLPANYIMGEHFRLGSHSVILSRSFCNINHMTDYGEIEEVFRSGVRAVREEEDIISHWTEEDFEQNRQRVQECVHQILLAC